MTNTSLLQFFLNSKCKMFIIFGPGVNVTKLFFSSLLTFPASKLVFVPSKPLHPQFPNVYHKLECLSLARFLDATMVEWNHTSCTAL